MMRLGVIIAALLTAVSCVRRPAYVFNEGGVFGTSYHIAYQSPDGRDLHDEIKEEMARVNHSLSMFDSTSVISCINRNVDVTPDSLFLHVFNAAQDISEVTGGAFDITVAPLVNAWGFGFRHKETVTQTLLDSLLQFVGYRKVRLQDGRVVKEHPSSMLDCSAIAKGFGCDVIAALLREHGCRNYMVEIGGEVVACGLNSKGLIWRIGIRKPSDNAAFGNTELYAVAALPAQAMATSGNYINFYEEDGVKYAHTIDPHTGRPVQHSLLSASVIADNCLTADAYATAFMVLGFDASKELLATRSDMQACFILDDNNGGFKTWMTEGFGNFLQDN
ncbi:MAG: FAD:protein FMN transferase [Bacteroidales bacterium]|jgi:thiamine biosynthesis lipoprotein|nr:FAD:protein FMN transferase [Bacteroidales bacterium]